MKSLFKTIALLYFKIFAKLQLAKLKPQIIGLTGTAGKSSLQRALVAILSKKNQVKSSQKNNSEIGIPLNILNLQVESNSLFEWLKFAVMAPLRILFDWQKYDYYIVEMAIDGPLPPNNMTYLLSIVSPDIGIVLNAKVLHSDSFDHLVPAETKDRAGALKKLIAEEKGQLVKTLEAHKTAIINYDDVNVKNLADRVIAKKIFFSQKSKKALRQDVDFFDKTDQVIRCKDINYVQQSSVFKFEVYHPQKDKVKHKIDVKIDQYLLPYYYQETLGAALATALSLGVDLEQASSALAHLNLPPGRATLVQGIKESLIIDSSYNSSLVSLLGFFALVEQYVQTDQRPVTLVLGDLREIGALTRSYHQRLAREILKLNQKLENGLSVYLVGPEMHKHALPVLLDEKEYSHQNKINEIKHFKSTKQAASYLKQHLSPKSLILVKSSQNTLLFEIIVKALMKHPEQAKSILCRRKPMWDRIRADL